MRTTMDAAGRLVIPKQLRAALGAEGRSEVELTERDGVIVVSIAATAMHVEHRDGRPVVVPDDADLPPLTAEAVREVTERTRR